MDFNEFSLRYAIISALAVVAVYMLVMLLRLIRIKLSRRPAGDGMNFDAQGSARLDAFMTSQREHERSAPEAQRLPRAQEQEREQYSADFGEQLYRSGVEIELQQLRSQVAELKETIAQLKAARRVSPQYNEAMLLAQRGMDEQEIANQCGISIGEAELVRALSRNKQEYEDYDGKNDGRA